MTFLLCSDIEVRMLTLITLLYSVNVLMPFGEKLRFWRNNVVLHVKKPRN